MAVGKTTVNENLLTIATIGIDPAVKYHLLTDMRCAQLAAGVGPSRSRHEGSFHVR